MKKQNQLRCLFAAVAAGVMTVLTASATLDLPAPMPEFMDDAQLETWRNDQIAESNAREAAAAAATQSYTPGVFFTGKPLMEETGEYAFLFRNYNPELARWSSEDPSGFPDGPNNLAYMAVPTSQFDWQGLESIDFNTKITLFQRKHGGQLAAFTGSSASLNETRKFYLEIRSDPYTQEGREWMHEQWIANSDGTRDSPLMQIQYNDKNGMEVQPSLSGYMWGLLGFDGSTDGGWNLQEGFPMYLNNNKAFIGGAIVMTINYQGQLVYNHTVNITE